MTTDKYPWLCPRCNGRKQVVQLVRLANETCEERVANCNTCDGRGAITSALQKQHTRANELYTLRVNKAVSLHDAAATLGITPVELSGLEHARLFDEALMARAFAALEATEASK